MNSIVVPVAAKELIDEVIMADEGGWVLTTDSNDGNGGWTYGGMTDDLYADHTGSKLSADYVKLILSQPEQRERFVDKIYEIYYVKFYSPIGRTLPAETGSDPFTHDSVFAPAHFSYAINRGIANWEKINFLCNHDMHRFCKLWKKEYIDMVQANSKAWRDYALAQEELGRLNPWTSKETVERIEKLRQVKKPPNLKSEYLEGWLNRVERYA